MNNNYYIKFVGNVKQLAIATDIFNRVCALQYNTRALKTYAHKGGTVIEYPANMKKFKEFYQHAIRRLYIEPDFDGEMPKVVIPV